jgi:hypothetical protein
MVRLATRTRDVVQRRFRREGSSEDVVSLHGPMMICSSYSSRARSSSVSTQMPVIAHLLHACEIIQKVVPAP